MPWRSEELEPPSVPPPYAKPMTCLDPLLWVEFEGPKECSRMEAPGGRQRILGLELDAAHRDERHRIDLGRDGVELWESFRPRLLEDGHRVWSQCRRLPYLRVPLQDGDQVLGILFEQFGKAGQSGRDTPKQRVWQQPLKLPE